MFQLGHLIENVHLTGQRLVYKLNSHRKGTLPLAKRLSVMEELGDSFGSCNVVIELGTEVRVPVSAQSQSAVMAWSSATVQPGVHIVTEAPGLIVKFKALVNKG